MAKANFTLCETCGGLTGISIDLGALIDGETIYTPEMPELVSTCTCQPEPTPKHSGYLDEQREAFVGYGPVYQSFEAPKVRGVHIDKIDDGVHLEPAQALSLLAWLRQEEAELQRLAKEQQG